MTKLKIGPIKLATTDGPIVIAGWHDGTFGADWRACYHDLDGSPGGYVISHLRSGYALLAIVANIEDVEAFIAKLHPLGDWSVSTPEQAGVMLTANRPAIKALFDTVVHHDPECFAMAPGNHGCRTFGTA